MTRSSFLIVAPGVVRYPHAYLLHFILFNFVFLSLQFIYIATQSGSFLAAIPLPLLVYLEIVATCLIQLLLYLFLSLVQSWLLWGIASYSREKIALAYWQAFIFSISISALLMANCYFFPLSVFSRLFLPELPTSIVLSILSTSLIMLALLILNAIWQTSLKLKLAIFILLGWLLWQVYPKPLDAFKKQAAFSTKPNIILIGIDSLTPTHINPNTTPTLYQFVQESIYFKQAISPLARTYAAWASILTGLMPLHHQARYNLMPSTQVKSQESLAWALQKKGYQTVFATDDRRFNSIDHDFGFEEILGPKLGVNDILLGTFNDFPLSNLLINLPISRWLFPYNHLNRASFFSYYPSAFDQTLQKFIWARDPKKPLFMAVHFALPHWPYAWAQSTPAEVKNEYSVTERGRLYFEAIHKADEQIGLLLTQLQQTGTLDNSLLIVLSDHGEVLYEAGSRPLKLANYQGGAQNLLNDYFKRKTSTSLEMSTGHGSDLLSPEQFHCLLGIKIVSQGQVITPAKTINNRVSLIDLAPTIYAFLRLPLKQRFDGLSLLETVKHRGSLPNKRAFILESGELPNQIVSKDRARLLGKLLYQVNPSNNQLELRPDRLHILDAIKLYAILQEDWLLALYPDDYQYLTVALHLKDGKWSDQWDTLFVQASPAPAMLKQLLSFYPHDLAMYPHSKLSPQFSLETM